MSKHTLSLTLTTRTTAIKGPMGLIELMTDGAVLFQT